MKDTQSSYTLWEIELISNLCDMLTCNNSDAQGFLEANNFYATQAWGLDLDAKQAAEHIIKKSTK